MVQQVCALFWKLQQRIYSWTLPAPGGPIPHGPFLRPQSLLILPASGSRSPTDEDCDYTGPNQIIWTISPSQGHLMSNLNPIYNLNFLPCNLASSHVWG